MDLTEIFDHQEPLEWQSTGRYLLSSFVINGSQYVIQIEDKKIPGLDLDKSAEVSFFENSETDSVFTTRNNQSASTRVYGAVLHGLADQFKNYDAFYFTAEQRHSMTTKQFTIKNKIYLMAGQHIQKNHDGFLYERHDVIRSAYLVTRRVLTTREENITGFRNGLKEAMNKLGLKFFASREHI